MSFVAIGQFVAGAKLCNRKDPQVRYLVEYTCYVIKPGYFSTAAIEALISMGLTLFYYLVIASTQNVPSKPQSAEVEAPSVTNDNLIPPLPPQM